MFAFSVIIISFIVEEVETGVPGGKVGDLDETLREKKYIRLKSLSLLLEDTRQKFGSL